MHSFRQHPFMMNLIMTFRSDLFNTYLKSYRKQSLHSVKSILNLTTLNFNFIANKSNSDLKAKSKVIQFMGAGMAYLENREMPLSPENEGIYFETLKDNHLDYRIVNTHRFGAAIISETESIKLENEHFMWRLNQRRAFGDGEFSPFCYKCLGCPLEYCCLCNQMEVMLFVLDNFEKLAKTRYCLNCNCKRGPLMYGDWARFVPCDHIGTFTERIGNRTCATDLALFIAAKTPRRCPYCFETNTDYRGNSISASYYCWECNKNFWKHNDIIEIYPTSFNSYAALISNEERPRRKDTLTWLTECCNVKYDTGLITDLFIYNRLQPEIAERNRVLPVLRRLRNEAIAADIAINPENANDKQPARAVVADDNHFEWRRMWEAV